ncbi:DUF4044 domain-containing protein [Carnobacterium mobile]|nr:DUF4044 domain-containing protein [Carnobacterium mobile]
MANKKDTKQISATKKWTKVFVWVMLVSMLGSGFISVIYTLLAS